MATTDLLSDNFVGGDFTSGGFVGGVSSSPISAKLNTTQVPDYNAYINKYKDMLKPSEVQAFYNQQKKDAMSKVVVAGGGTYYLPTESLPSISKSLQSDFKRNTGILYDFDTKDESIKALAEGNFITRTTKETYNPEYGDGPISEIVQAPGSIADILNGYNALKKLGISNGLDFEKKFTSVGLSPNFLGDQNRSSVLTQGNTVSLDYLLGFAEKELGAKIPTTIEEYNRLVSKIQSTVPQVTEPANPDGSFNSLLGTTKANSEAAKLKKAADKKLAILNNAMLSIGAGLENVQSAITMNIDLSKKYGAGSLYIHAFNDDTVHELNKQLYRGQEKVKQDITKSYTTTLKEKLKETSDMYSKISSGYKGLV